MKTINLRVSGLLGGLDHLAIEKRLRALRGVEHASMNPASESATVTYDEAVTTFESIKSAIDECGFHCRGEALPQHLCEPTPTTAERYAASHRRDGDGGDRTAARPAIDQHAGHRAPPVASVGGQAQSRVQEHDSHADMGHSGDMQTMVRDLRRRFLVALLFAVPVFFYSQMGDMLGGFKRCRRWSGWN